MSNWLILLAFYLWLLNLLLYHLVLFNLYVHHIIVHLISFFYFLLLKFTFSFNIFIDGISHTLRVFLWRIRLWFLNTLNNLSCSWFSWRLRLASLLVACLIFLISCCDGFGIRYSVLFRVIWLCLNLRFSLLWVSDAMFVFIFVIWDIWRS